MNAADGARAHSPAQPTTDQLPPRVQRRGVELSAYLVRSNKTVVDVKIVNLSYDGCAVHTTVPLSPGEVVRLSVLGGRAPTSAIVRWYSGRKAGLQFETADKPRASSPRKVERLEVEAQALLRRAGCIAFPVTVFDMTLSGCRCEFVDRPAINERVWIKLDGLASMEASVCWIEQSMVGLTYKLPLHPAVFEMLTARISQSQS